MREPAGSMHGRVAMNLGAELRAYAKAMNAGVVFAAETGFKLQTDPDTVRAADVAFVAQGACRRPTRRDSPSWRPIWWWRCCRPTTGLARSSPRLPIGCPPARA